MRGFSARRHMDASPAELWPLIGDLTRHGEWSADPLVVTAVGNDRYASRATSRGTTFTAQIQVVTSNPEELLEFRVRDSTGTYNHRIGLSELEERTLVTRQVTPERLNLGQQMLASAARSTIRIPSLEASLERLEQAVGISL